MFQPGLIMKLSCHTSTTGCSSCYTECIEKSKSNYRRIKLELRRANPSAIVLWAFHRIPSSKEGLTSRQVIGFLKKHYKVSNDPSRTGKAIGNTLRSAVEFGLLRKVGNRYFLATRT